MNDITDLKQKTAIATKFSTYAEIISKLMTPLINIILARILTPEDFGVVATVTMVTSFADIFTDAGFQKYIMQHEFQSDTDLENQTNVAFWTNFCMSLILWICIALYSGDIAKLVGNEGLGGVIIVSGLSLPLTSFSSIQMARYKRSFDFKTLLYIRVVSSILPLIVTVPLALATRSYWALILGTLVGNIVNAVLLTIKSEWKPKLYYNIKIFRQMFSYSWWILLESIALWFASYIGTFIVGMKLSQYYVGIYKTSITTVNQIMNLIIAATSSPLFVALANLKNNNKNLKRTYMDYIESISIFVIPLGIGIFEYKDLVVKILLGSQWDEAADFIGLWAVIFSYSVVLGTYCNGLYNAVGKTFLSFSSQVLQLIVLIPTLIWAVNIDFTHLYIARSVVRIELILVQLIIMKVVFKFSIIEQIKIIIPSTLCSLLIILIGHITHLNTSNIIIEIISVVICIVGYFGLFICFFKDKFIQALEILGIKNL